MKKVMRVTILAMSLVLSLITVSSAANQVVTLTVGNWDFNLGYDVDPAPYFDITGIYSGTGAENVVHGAAAFIQEDTILEIGLFGNAYDIDAEGNITRADYTIRAKLNSTDMTGVADYACPHWNSFMGDMPAKLTFGEAPTIKETTTPPGVK
ncbi:MAG: hypothetical protein AB1414_21325 [bacterium]